MVHEHLILAFYDVVLQRSATSADVAAWAAIAGQLNDGYNLLKQMCSAAAPEVTARNLPAIFDADMTVQKVLAVCDQPKYKAISTSGSGGSTGNPGMGALVPISGGGMGNILTKLTSNKPLLFGVVGGVLLLVIVFMVFKK
jgi:hypothetical protein